MLPFRVAPRKRPGDYEVRGISTLRQMAALSTSSVVLIDLLLHSLSRGQKQKRSLSGTEPSKAGIPVVFQASSSSLFHSLFPLERQRPVRPRVLFFGPIVCSVFANSWAASVFARRGHLSTGRTANGYGAESTYQDSAALSSSKNCPRSCYCDSRFCF